MNLIQRGTTASRANRGKSVNDSIAQRKGCPSYGGNRLSGQFDLEDFRRCWRLTAEKNEPALARLERALLDRGHRDLRFVVVGEGAERKWLQVYS